MPEKGFTAADEIRVRQTYDTYQPPSRTRRVNVVNLGKLNPADAKAKFLELVASGVSESDATIAIGRGRGARLYWCESDPIFAAEYEALKLRIAVKRSPRQRDEVPDFPEFCKVYLDLDLYWHQLQWFDLLEGRAPRQLHDSQTFEPGDPNLLIVNTPPYHAKSSTLTVAYVVWRLCRDPNDLITIVSKTQTMARKFLYAIKNRLTHPRYQELQTAFGPPGGFAAGSAGWNQDAIYLSPDVRDSQEKDPTVQAVGIRGHIYGSRGNLFVLDDCVDRANANDFDNQIDWVLGEVQSRVGEDGKILVVGTRMAGVDLYLEIRSPGRYPDGISPWTYFAQPAVLTYAPEPKDWVTLWPASSTALPGTTAQPNPHGLYRAWDGAALAKRRERTPVDTWARVYQQQQIATDTVFPIERLQAACDSGRSPGLLHAGNRRFGMDGLFIVAGLDPAVSGHTAAVCMAVDRTTRRRWVIDVYNAVTLPDGIFDLIKNWTTIYNIMEWRIEKNAMNMMITQSRPLREWLATRGTVLREHFTDARKWDETYGISSLAPLFDPMATPEGTALVSLPSLANPVIRTLVDQFASWFPGCPKTQKTDIIMAFWFAEIRARELCEAADVEDFLPSRWLTRLERENQMVVDIDELINYSNVSRVVTQ